MLVGEVTVNPLGLLVAFGAGILSFLSPCVLPLVPGYLSMVSGLSTVELRRGRRQGPRAADGSNERFVAVPAAVGSASPIEVGLPVGATVVSTPATSDSLDRSTSQRPTKRLLRGTLLFVAGFTLVFVVLGAAASGVGHLLGAHRHALATVSGATIVVLGLILMLGALPASVWARVGGGVSSRVAWLMGERRFHTQRGALSIWVAPVMGMAFGFAWTPCIGPVLGAVLALAASRSTLAGGMMLLLAYSMGLGVPFVATGVAFERLTGLYAKARAPLAFLQVLAALVLVSFGVILLAGDLGWLSAQVNSLLNALGMHCSTASGCFA